MSVCNEVVCLCVSGDRASEEWEADVGASDSLGGAEVSVWRSTLAAVDQPLRWTQTTNPAPQTHLEGRCWVLGLTSCGSTTAQWRRRTCMSPAGFAERCIEPQWLFSEPEKTRFRLGCSAQKQDAWSPSLNAWPLLTFLGEIERSNLVRLTAGRCCWMCR